MDKNKVAMKMAAFELLMWLVMGRQPLPLNNVEAIVEDNGDDMFAMLSMLARQYHETTSPKETPLVTLGISPEGLDGNYRHPFIRQGFHYQMRVTKDGKILGEIPPDSGRPLRGMIYNHRLIVDTLHEIINYDLTDELFLTLGRLMRGRLIASYVGENPDEFKEGEIPTYMAWLNKLLVKGF